MSRVSSLRVAGVLGALIASACSSGSRNVTPLDGASAPAPVSAAEPVGDAGGAFEGEVLVKLYDELSTVFVQHAEDCSTMRSAGAAALAQHKPAVQAWGQSLSALTPAQAAEVETRLKAAAGQRMDAFRTTLNQALAKCSAEMMPLLQELSGLVGKPQQ
jgi:hypothetical protein